MLMRKLYLGAVFLLCIVLPGSGLVGQSLFPEPVEDGFFRVVTWNIRNFPEPTTDVNRVAQILLSLDADLIAVQEIHDRTELQNLLNAVNTLSADRHQQEGTRLRSYGFELSGDGGAGNQFVGFVYDEYAVQLTQVGDLTSLQMSPDLRPGFFARVRSLRGGLDFQIIANHTDSGVNLTDYQNRQTFLSALGAEVADRWDDEPDFIVLGDLNTMGRSQSGGQPTVHAQEELSRMDQALSNMGFRRIPASPACSEYYNQEGSFLDHILVPLGMREAPPHAVAQVYGYCRLLQCRPYATGSGPYDYVHASDHCPVVLDLIDVDWG
jgi:endonuclease/exonuclease/phosphatase family metal-dependent hydrolase